jgi:hypothetical protein
LLWLSFFTRADRIEATRATIVRQKAAVVRTEEITLEELLGEGTFGKVYKGGAAAAYCQLMQYKYYIS